MRLNQSDKILATVKQIVGQKVYADTGKWNNISKLIIRKGGGGRTFVLGQDVVAEINHIDGEAAYATALRAPYSRHLWPGDSIEVTPTHFSTNGLAVANYDGGTVSQVHVLNALPEEPVYANIMKICGDIAIGDVVSRATSDIEVGDRLIVTVESGASVGELDRGVLNIPMGKTEIKEKIDIRITELGETVRAEIAAPGRLPVHGNELKAKITEESSVAEVIDSDYNVKLTQSALATGEVRVAVEADESVTQPTASVISYGELLPEIGDSVTAVSREGKSQANPVSGSYSIALDQRTKASTEVEIEITGINNRVEGKIIDPGALPRPGNEVEGQVERRSARAVVSGPEYSIELSEPSLITGKVTVGIESQDEDTVTGRVVSYRGQIPEVGDTIQAVTRAGGNVAIPENGTYEVVIDETTPAAVEVDIRIREVDEQVEGEIVDYGRMPLTGRAISTNVILDKSVANVPDSYRVELDSRSLASGTATVKILSAPDSVHAGTVVGKVVSYGDSLPSRGETVRAKIDSKNGVAKPITGRYKIQLSNVGGRHGTGIVKITTIDNCVRGKIVEMDREKTSRRQSNPFSGSKNDLISNKKL